jgi:hypothetical protein
LKKAKANPSSHQLELKAKHKLSNQQFQEMLEMLAELTPAELKTLKDPDFITEDEADLIVNDRRMKEPGRGIPVEEVFEEFGYTPRSRRSA